MRQQTVALSGRQRRIAGMLAAGALDETIARRLGVSVRTVRAEIAEILVVFRAVSRFQAGSRYAVWRLSADRATDGEAR